MFPKSKIYFLTTALLLFFYAGIPTSAQTPRKIVCLGDSITNGYYSHFRTPDNLPCTKRARDGRPTSEMVSEFRTNIRGQGFTDLIIMGGTNDMASDQDATRGITNLGTIYRLAKEDNMRVVAVTILPFAGLTRYGTYRSDPVGTQARIDRLNAFVRSSGMDAIVDAYVALGNPADPTFLNPAYDSGDGIHPSDPVGRQFLAQTISAQGFGGAAPSGGPVTVPEKPIITPRLNINIPGVSFSQPAQQGGFLNLPFLADYISGLYKYLLSILGVLAGTVLTIGGVQYLMAAGNKSAIDAALKRIKGALIGLTLALGSYLILFTINPQLVTFSGLRVEYVPAIPLNYASSENGGMSYGTSESFNNTPGSFSCANSPKCANPNRQGFRGTTHEQNFTDYDTVFQKYAGCGGIDWRILKAVAFKESRFDSSAVNCCGFRGLFQMNAAYCSQANLASFSNFSASSCNKENLTNVDVNVAAAAINLGKYASIVKRKCPTIDTQRLVALLYLAHNSGPGSLNGTNRSRGVLSRVSCNGDIIAGAAAFWQDQDPSVPNASGRGAYAMSVGSQAVSYGVQTPFVQGDCPLTRTGVSR